MWRWLQNVFKGSSNSTKVALSPAAEDKGEIPPLSDEDYNFLFGQLLDGVAHGWQAPRVQRFFEQLGEQGKHPLWIRWLQQSYGPKVLASPVPDLELSKKLVLLAHQTQYLPKIMEVGAMANAIAQSIQQKATINPIWEYDGPDAGSLDETQAAQPEYITPDELLKRLEQDPAFAQQLAAQLGINETEPQVLLRVLLQRFQQDGQS
ncbi:MAG: hypothetical protein SW833_03470 [Cyanobacteriota bacterium]|nr:hypothetical protein [Cyanobacteriota bacterium]